MTSFGFLLHHLGYKPNREEIKNIIEIDNDIPEAQNKLNSVIAEHDLIKQEFNDDNIIDTDNRALHHAQIHMEQAEVEPEQKQAALDALDEEVD